MKQSKMSLKRFLFLKICLPIVIIVFVIFLAIAITSTIYELKRNTISIKNEIELIANLTEDLKIYKVIDQNKFVQRNASIIFRDPFRDYEITLTKNAPIRLDKYDDIFISNLEEYISKYDDHCCPICNGWKKSASDDEEEHDTTNAIHTSGITKETLAIIPEVLGIQINHNWNKTIGKNIKKNQYFPMELKFKKKGEDAYLHYKLVGQIEQSGSTTGGHYWARCLRNGEVYIINDTSVRKSRFECTPETCFIIYHHYLPTK